MPSNDEGFDNQRFLPTKVNSEPLATSSGSNNSKDEKDAWLSSSLWGGLSRSSFYALQRLGLSTSMIRTFLKKKAFLLIGQRPAESVSGYDFHISKESIDRHDHFRAWKSSRAGRVADIAKSSILGVAVFGVYDYLILHHRNNRHSSWKQDIDVALQSSCHSQKTPTRIRLDSMVSWNLDDPLPLSLHFQAGALAGLIQSFILDAWEIGQFHWVNHRLSSSSLVSFSYWSNHMKAINTELILRRALHHSVGYASLFGCYEGLRVFIGQSSIDYLMNNPMQTINALDTIYGSNTANNDKQIKVFDVTLLPIVVALFAGGLAGQAHLIVSHYLHQWKIGSLAKKHPRHSIQWNHVHWRPLLSTFLPAGISFVAFQYAGELTEQWVTQAAAEQIPRSQLFL